MKYFKRIGLAVLCAWLCFMPMPVQARANFDIYDYDVEMVVHEDGSVDVHETIDVDFSTSSHGLYRNIPIRYDMNWGEFGKKRYYFPVENITVLNDMYEVETDSNGVSIKIGDPDRYVSGSKTYDISYTIQMRDLMIDQDYFYMNLLGGFDCKIYGGSFTIEFPKSFDASQLKVYLDGVNYSVDGNVVSGMITATMVPNEYLTVFLPLGQDYFDFKEIPDYSFIMILVCIVAIGLAAFLYVKFGMKKNPIVTVEFSAPDHLGSTGVGYVIDGVVNNKDVLSMIIDFANRGYLSIYEGKEDTTLTKLKEMNDECNGYERSFFKALFEEGDEVTLQQLQDRHFGDQIAMTKELVSSYFREDQHKVFNNASLGIQIVLLLLAGMGVGLLGFASYYHKIGMIDVAIAPLVILWPFMSISMVFWILLSRQKYAYSKFKLFGMMLLAIACHGFVFLLSFAFIDSLVNCVVAFVYTVLMISMIYTCGKRTEQGNRWLGQILGLKTFIEVAEKDQLEMLVHENPSYFYHILPYAYVLGISDTWSKKFETIDVLSPEWYSSYDSSTFSTIYWMNHFNRTMSGFNELPGAITPSSSSGGFSGGGGYSGGGFGGGGGGSW